MDYTELRELPRLRTADALLKEAAELSQQAEELKAQEMQEAIARIRDLINAYGITIDMVMPRKAPRKVQVKRKLPPKYRDPLSGVTWAGRGKTPQWVRDYLHAGGVMDTLRV